MITSLKNYNKSVNYLYSLQKYGIKLGLENPCRLMDILGSPQKSFRSIHIAGTNGKGSTAAILASILKANGCKVGLFTSPHLVSFTERIKINNAPISESGVIRLTSYIRKAIAGAGLKPTFFEFITAMAFYYFACEKVDWAVVEVGMGGRLDATNVLLPVISIITNVGIDHNEFLGETISDIAFEKAGIIKPMAPLVTATSHPEALRVLKNTAKKHGSDIHIYGRDFKSALIFMDNKHIVFDYRSINSSAGRPDSCREHKTLSLPAPGKHQLYNASLAIRACEILTDKEIPISPDALKNGLLNARSEGRFESISQTPPIIIDSAHNPEAARALTDTVKNIFPLKKIILITGIMKDKDIKGILKPLIKISDEVILTKPEGERAASPEELKDAAENIQRGVNKNNPPLRVVNHHHFNPPLPPLNKGGLGGINSKGGQSLRGAISTANTVAGAIELAKTIWQEDCIILITGSFYTTGEAKEYLGKTGVFSDLRE